MIPKPRLLRLRGIWYCRAPNTWLTWYGMGYSASDAYSDWLKGAP